MSAQLTPEQRQRIEENRKKALEKLAAKSIKPVSTPVSNVKTELFKSSKNGWNKYQSGNFSGVKKMEEKTKSWNVLTDTLKGTCTLIGKNRFAVEIPYNSKVIDLMKSIPGREYDQNKRCWNFPLEQYDALKAKLAPLSPTVIVGNIPTSVIKAIKDTELQDYTNTDVSKIEPVLLNSLFPFQVDGVKFGVFKNGKCLIADEMGLGKTLQALAIADYYREEWPVLIVCPSSMRFQWQEEILKYLPKVPSYSIVVVTSGKTSITDDYKILIVSYDLLVKFKDVLKKSNFGVIIFDESHSLKSVKTQRTKAALEVVEKMKRIILLSGTPALSRPIELYPQIKILQPSLFRQMTEYGIRYCDGKKYKFGWNFQGSSHLEELKLILEEKLMIRRLKVNVLKELPSKMRQVITLTSDANMKNKKMVKLERMLSDSKNIKGIEKRSTLLAYYAESGIVKTPAIIKYLEDLLEANKKFLCFAHHKAVLDAICELLEKKETYYIRIDGSVSSEERKAVCDKFQEEDKYRVAVLSITAANMGVTLTAAQHVVFAELYWNPGELIQAEDRAHRIGQESSVLVQYLIAKETADDYLWPLVQSKLNVLNQAGLSKDTNLSIENTIHKSEENQTSITQYFSEIDNVIDETDLSNLMDEIEGLQPKKKKCV